MKRGWKTVIGIAAGLAVGLAVLLLIAVIFIATFNWNRLKPTVDSRISAAIGRSFVIHGNVTVDWQRDPQAGGLQAWLPWPHFTARQVTIDNPDWAQKPLFAEADALRFSVSPWALLHQRIDIPLLRLVHPRLDLERPSPDRANWHFHSQTNGSPSNWTLDLEQIAFDQGSIDLCDEPTQITLHATLHALAGPIPYQQVVNQQVKAARSELAARFDQPLDRADSSAPTSAASGGSGNAAKSTSNHASNQPDTTIGNPIDSTRYRFAWTLKGSYRGAPLSGQGMSGGVLAFRDADHPFPVQLDVQMAHSRMALVGTLNKPLNLGGLDVRLWLAGASMGDLYPTTGINLPTTPPYSTEGHLLVTLKDHGSRYSYQQFNGRVGRSDLAGTLTFDTTGAQPTLTGKVHSDQLRAADLGTLIGNGTGDHASAQATEQPSKPPGQVLPVAKFQTDRWRAMDASVDFTGNRVEDQPLPPMTDLSTHIKLKNGMLQLSPLRVGLAGGTIAGTITLDGSRSPMPGALTLDVRHIELKHLFPAVKAMKASLGQINGGLDLQMRGNSVAALLGSADGELKLLMNDGAISKMLLEEAGLNLGHVVMAKLFGTKTVQINCAAADLPANDGVFKARLFVLDTPDATVRVDGTINLASERFDLTVRPHTKGLRLLSLRTPLTIQGTLKNPDVGVKPGPLIARAAAAVALGVIAAPAAALLALVAPGKDSDGQNTCRAVLQKLHEQASPAKGANAD